MDNKAQMIKNNESLKYQLNIERMPLSKSGAELRDYCNKNLNNDPLISPVDKKENPFAEKSKCSVL